MSSYHGQGSRREGDSSLEETASTFAMSQGTILAEPAGSQPAAKRKRGQYTNLAWYLFATWTLGCLEAHSCAPCSYECKKRKTKCNSERPCSQCAKAGKDCKLFSPWSRSENNLHQTGTFPPHVPRRRGTTL